MGLEQRIRMATESILENESLRAGLEDEAASVLMDWGIAQARQIVAGTAQLEDETEAEEAMYPRMRALRQMLLAIGGLSQAGLDIGQRDQYLQELDGLAAQVYGRETIPGAEQELGQFLASQAGSGAQRISQLLAFIENDQQKGE